MGKGFSHIDSQSGAKIVDVSGKSETLRQAHCRAVVKMSTKCFSAVRSNSIKKGDLFTVAKIAGIQGAKRCYELIPLCHNILISDIEISFNLLESSNSIEIMSSVRANSVTGVEMEALTAVSIAALTIYDMCKSMDKSIVITDIELIKKMGGKSGEYNKKGQVI